MGARRPFKDTSACYNADEMLFTSLLSRLLEDKKSLFLVVGTVSVLFALFIYGALISPRPYYYTQEIDIEHDYYYNARLINAGLPLRNFHHPGTPIYSLGAGILKVSGAAPDQAQRFFTISHLLVVLLCAVSIAIFVGITLKRIPWGVSLLAVASIVAWPTFLTYLDHYGAEAFIVVREIVR